MVYEALWPQRQQAVRPDLMQWLNGRFYLLAKRTMDLTIVVLAAPILLPLFGFIAVLIKLDSPGPVIFRQTRVGARCQSRGLRHCWEQRLFECYKFRTMFHNCDQSLHVNYITNFVNGQVEASDENGLPYKLNGDPRVTRTGRWLRKLSLDELPQVFNIVKGEMSLVGPRPVPEYEVAAYQEWHRERLQALPGLTGMWQVYGRSRVTFDEMAQLDIEYVHRRSLLLDIKLLLATVPAVITGNGAG